MGDICSEAYYEAREGKDAVTEAMETLDAAILTADNITAATIEDIGPKYKFREDELLTEFWEYINSTYDQHYARDKFQATEFIIDGGHGTGFCIGNVLKYAQRYGKKGTPADARKDILKVLHYALMQLHVHDLENKG